MTEEQRRKKNARAREVYWQNPELSRAKSRAKQLDKEKRKAAEQRFHARHPEKRAEFNRKAKYGLTAEKFAIMLETQKGLCAICKTEPKQFTVDHCHQSNNVRGLLCHDCNLGLGRFKDSIGNLKQAIQYLTKENQ